MKIIIRIPTESYAYHEVEFNSLEEYNKEYPKFIEDFIAMRKTINSIKKSKEVPFED